MKKILLIAATGLMTLSALAQPQLRKDNIDEVLAAMTLEENQPFPSLGLHGTGKDDCS